MLIMIHACMSDIYNILYSYLLLLLSVLAQGIIIPSAVECDYFCFQLPVILIVFSNYPDFHTKSWTLLPSTLRDDYAAWKISPTNHCKFFTAVCVPKVWRSLELPSTLHFLILHSFIANAHYAHALYLFTIDHKTCLYFAPFSNAMCTRSYNCCSYS